MKISLNPQLERFIEDEVKAVHYASADELIEAAVARLMLDPEDDEIDDETMAKIEEAEAQFDRGEGISVDEVFAKLRQKHSGI